MAEVFDVICGAASPDAAQAALRSLLDVGTVSAAAIADLQLRRCTEQERDRLTA